MIAIILIDYTSMPTEQDTLYAQPLTHVDGFRFDEKVARVFADMISRSVPGYTQILALLPTLVKSIKVSSKHTNDNPPQNYYDLGCSLGAGLAAMAQGFENNLDEQNSTEPNHFIGIDNSKAMLEGARKALDTLNSTQNFELQHGDINDAKLSNAAAVLMNFTLQFIPLEQRDALIEKIFGALHHGGFLVLSEKIKISDVTTEQHLIDIHHQYKSDQGYSQLEISQKRDSIENVLIPETLSTHVERLKKAGFNVITPWIQNLQFVSILAIKT